MNDQFDGVAAVIPGSDPEARIAGIEAKLDEAVATLNRISRQQEMVGDLKEESG